MHGTFYTLQEFLFHTESITYLLVIPALLAITGFWCFLASNDD